MNVLNIFLMTGQDGESGPETMIMLVLMIGVFYFFMIRPQTKKQKEMKKFREDVKKGDRIVTIGGIHGKISEMGETTIVIEVEGGKHLKIERSAISLEMTNGQGTSELTEKK